MELSEDDIIAALEQGKTVRVTAEQLLSFQTIAAVNLEDIKDYNLIRTIKIWDSAARDPPPLQNYVAGLLPPHISAEMVQRDPNLLHEFEVFQHDHDDLAFESYLYHHMDSAGAVSDWFTVSPETRQKISDNLSAAYASAKKAASSAYQGAKRVASATYEGSKKAAAVTYEGSKRAAAATYRGAQRAAEATARGSQTAYEYAKVGAEYAAHGSKVAGKYVAQASKSAAKQIAEGSKTTGRAIAQGSRTAGKFIQERGGKAAVEGSRAFQRGVAQASVTASTVSRGLAAAQQNARTATSQWFKEYQEKAKVKAIEQTERKKEQRAEAEKRFEREKDQRAVEHKQRLERLEKEQPVELARQQARQTASRAGAVAAVGAAAVVLAPLALAALPFVPLALRAFRGSQEQEPKGQTSEERREEIQKEIESRPFGRPNPHQPFAKWTPQLPPSDEESVLRRLRHEPDLVQPMWVQGADARQYERIEIGGQLPDGPVLIDFFWKDRVYGLPAANWLADRPNKNWGSPLNPQPEDEVPFFFETSRFF